MARGRPCSTCALPPDDLVAVHDEVDGKKGSLRSIAHAHGLEPRSLTRHLASHRKGGLVPSSVVLPGVAVDEPLREDDLLGRALRLVQRCDDILATAGQNPLLALKAVAEERLLLGSLSSLLKDLEERKATREFDLRVTAAWGELRDIVEEALADCPADCRARLVSALTREGATR